MGADTSEFIPQLQSMAVEALSGRSQCAAPISCLGLALLDVAPEIIPDILGAREARVGIALDFDETEPNS